MGLSLSLQMSVDDRVKLTCSPHYLSVCPFQDTRKIQLIQKISCLPESILLMHFWQFLIFGLLRLYFTSMTRGHACAKSVGWSWHSLVRGP